MQKTNEINQQLEHLKRGRRRLLECDADDQLLSDCRLLVGIIEFVGVDENGVARHAYKKSTATGSTFRINVEGNDPAYSFHYLSKNPNPHRLFVFEAPIDLLSYISLHPEGWQNNSYVALNGVSEKPVLKLLELYPRLGHVVLCLDNDGAGLNAASRIHNTLQQRVFENVEYDISAHKDWNEDLKAVLSQEQNKQEMAMA